MVMWKRVDEALQIVCEVLHNFTPIVLALESVQHITENTVKRLTLHIHIAPLLLALPSNTMLLQTGKRYIPFLSPSPIFSLIANGCLQNPRRWPKK
jgi:hypothetical protein